MSADDSPLSPLHGYRGELTPPPTAVRPNGVTIAVSRQTGSRGGTIAHAAGRLLGWQVFTQEMLDFLTQDERARDELVADLPAPARLWIEVETASLAIARKLDLASELGAAARLALTLAARGEVVVIGRGVGFLLPAATTVHARVVAPLLQRVAYFGQWQRLTDVEAEREVRNRDHRRAEFLAAMSGRDPAEPAGYDMVLNSDRLGVEGCAQQIVHAAREKIAAAGARWTPRDAA